MAARPRGAHPRPPREGHGRCTRAGRALRGRRRRRGRRTMKPSVALERSAPAAPSGEPRPLLRILAVASEGTGELVQSLRAWAEDAGLHVEGAPDLPRAVRQLAAERWDVVVAALGERADEELTSRVDALRGAVGGPRLSAAAQTHPMTLVLPARQLRAP